MAETCAVSWLIRAGRRQRWKELGPKHSGQGCNIYIYINNVPLGCTGSAPWSTCHARSTRRVPFGPSGAVAPVTGPPPCVRCAETRKRVRCANWGGQSSSMAWCFKLFQNCLLEKIDDEYMKYGQNFPEPFVGSKYFEKLPVAIRRVFAPISMSAAESWVDSTCDEEASDLFSIWHQLSLPALN